MRELPRHNAIRRFMKREHDVVTGRLYLMAHKLGGRARTPETMAAAVLPLVFSSTTLTILSGYHTGDGFNARSEGSEQ